MVPDSKLWLVWGVPGEYVPRTAVADERSGRYWSDGSCNEYAAAAMALSSVDLSKEPATGTGVNAVARPLMRGAVTFAYPQHWRHQRRRSRPEGNRPMLPLHHEVQGTEGWGLSGSKPDADAIANDGPIPLIIGCADAARDSWMPPIDGGTG